MIFEQQKDVIRGSGGGGGKGGGGTVARAPVEAPDSLQSRQVARVLDLICEGEIGGLVDGLKSVYLDETPVLAADGTANFTGAVIDTRNGTQAQTYIPGFEAQETETAVGVEVTVVSAVTRQVTNASVSAVRVTVGVPGLSLQDLTTGDLNGTSVEIKIEIQPTGGVFVTQNLNGAEIISGKTRSRYQRSYRLPLTGAAPWNIRVSRVTADSTASNLQNKTFWDSYTEIIETKLTYPNSALVGLAIDAKQFSTIPSRAYKMKLLLVRVPSNYNPTTRVYTGVWDGTFQIAWTDNPAWCFYDLVTNARYGLGDRVPAALLDKWSLYTIGQYCDVLVPNGFGGTEPRFTMNVYLQTQEEAYKVVNDLASTFRGMLYWASGGIFAVQDSPSDPVALFNASNVVGGVFSREGSGRKARHTVAIVTWNDPADFYRAKPEQVEDAAAIARYGVRKTEVVAFGCASQGQAHRVGKWLLFTEKYESEVISWVAGLDAAYVRPGQIAKIVDPGRSTARWGGRVISATANSVTIDSPVTLAAGVTYTLSVVLPDGTLVDRVVTNSAGQTSVLTFVLALPSTNIVQAVWVLGSPNLEPELVRVLSVAEASPTTYTITGLAHYPSKFAAVEQNLALQRPTTSALRQAPSAVTELVGSEYLYKESGNVRVRLVISFKPAMGAVRYLVQYRRSNGNWISLPVTSNNHVEVDDVVPDSYALKVTSIGPLGVTGQPVAASYIVLGKEGLPPSGVTGLTYSFDGSNTVLQWNQVADLDVADYEVRRGTVWLSAVSVGRSDSNVLRLGAYSAATTFLVKAFDTSGNESVNAASVVVTPAGPAQAVVSAVFDGSDVKLTWPAPAQGSYPIARYEIRHGATWAGGTSVGFVDVTIFRAQAGWSGARTWWVTAVDAAGGYGTPGSVIVTVNLPGQLTLQAQQSGNRVLLSWNNVTTTLPIQRYEVRQGVSWASAAFVAEVLGSSLSLPALAAATTFLVKAFDSSGNETATAGSITVTPIAPPAVLVSATIDEPDVRLTWPVPSGGSYDVARYEVRHGASWAGGTLAGFVDVTTFKALINWTGSRKWWAVAYDAAGNASTPAFVEVMITPPSQPVVAAEVIDNNVLLSWSDARQTLPIKHYEVRRGATFAGAAVIGIVSARFTVIFESASGQYTYWIVGVDSAGNYGTGGSLTTTVNQPPDYVLYNQWNSQLDSTNRSNWLRTFGNHYVLNFNGSTQYGQVSSIPDLDSGITGITLEAWFMTGNLLQAGGLIEKTVGGIVNTCASLFLGTGWIIARVIVGGILYNASASIATYQANQAIHAVMRWDGVNVKIALQGANVANAAAAGTLDQGAGALLVGTLGSGVYRFTGKLGPCRIYKRAINDTELAEHYNGIFKNETSLIAAWDFEEGSGTVSFDDTDNAYDLQLVSAPSWALSTLDGRNDLSLGAAKIYYPMKSEESVSEYQTRTGYLTPQGAIDAGYNYPVVPAPSTAQYVEVVDFGTVLAATKIILTLTDQAFLGSVAVTPKISIKKLAGDPWTDYAGVWQVFATNFRYVKITLDATSAGGNHVRIANQMTTRLDVKLINDAGMATCNSGDAGGTQVNFNIAFIDVQSITVTPSGTVARYGTYDFVDAPNPTGFKALLFDSAGARASGTASWSAKGV